MSIILFPADAIIMNWLMLILKGNLIAVIHINRNITEL